MQHVGHQFLKAHVLHAGDAFRALEIGIRPVAAGLALARVVDQELGHVAQPPAFLAVVDDQTGAAALRGLDADLDAVREVGPAGADVGAEDVGAVALVVHPAGELAFRIGDRGHVAEDIGRGAADRRQEDVQVGSCHQLGEHAAGLLEQRAPQVLFVNAAAPRHARQVPDRFEGDLGHADLAVLGQDRAVGRQPAGAHRVLQFGHIDAGLGDGDRRPDVPTVLQQVGIGLADDMAEGVERDDLVVLVPLRKRPDGLGGRSIGQVGFVHRVEVA